MQESTVNQNMTTTLKSKRYETVSLNANSPDKYNKILVEMDKPAIVDPVNHPAHYTTGKIEVIDFIEDKELDFPLGNAVKYIARAGKKDPSKEIEDLEKAIWYIRRKINNLKLKKGL